MTKLSWAQTFALTLDSSVFLSEPAWVLLFRARPPRIDPNKYSTAYMSSYVDAFQA